MNTPVQFRVPLHQRRRRRGGHAPSHGHRGRAVMQSRLPVARQPLTLVPEATPISSECLLDPDAWQRGVDTYAKSAGNAEWFQLPSTTSHHREVVSRGGHHSFVRPSDGCADAEAPVAGPHPANACRPSSAPCGVGAGPTSWTAIPAWQPLDGHALPTRRTSPASRRLPRMGTRHPIPLLPTGKPLRGTTPKMMMTPVL